MVFHALSLVLHKTPVNSNNCEWNLYLIHKRSPCFFLQRYVCFFFQNSFAFPSIIEMFTIVKSNDLGPMNKALISRFHAILINKSISNGALSQLNEKLLQ